MTSILVALQLEDIWSDIDRMQKKYILFFGKDQSNQVIF